MPLITCCFRTQALGSDGVSTEQWGNGHWEKRTNFWGEGETCLLLWGLRNMDVMKALGGHKHCSVNRRRSVRMSL